MNSGHLRQKSQRSLAAIASFFFFVSGGVLGTRSGRLGMGRAGHGVGLGWQIYLITVADYCATEYVAWLCECLTGRCVTTAAVLFADVLQSGSFPPSSTKGQGT